MADFVVGHRLGKLDDNRRAALELDAHRDAAAQEIVPTPAQLITTDAMRACHRHLMKL